MRIHQTIIIGLRILVGVTLIASALLKLIPIEPFEYKFVEVGVANWAVAPYLARFIIGVEVMLGSLLVFNIKPKWTILLTILLFLFFTIYLGIDILIHGDDENCGCFGTYIQFTSVESIAKNVLLLGLILIVYYRNKGAFTFYQNGFIVLFLILSFIGPYVLYPMGSIEDNVNKDQEKVGYKYPSHLMPDFAISNKAVDLSKGEHLVVFASVKCMHCKSMAYKLSLLNKELELPPIYFVFIGTDSLANEFQKETKTYFPYYMYNKSEFFKISGEYLPNLFYLKDGIVQQKFNNNTLTDKTLLKAMGK